MKPSHLILAATIVGMASCTTREVVEADYNVVPLPMNVEKAAEGAFRFSPSTCLVAADSAQRANARLFADYVETLTGFRPTVCDKAPRKDYIRLTASNKDTKADGYAITVATDSIVIDGADAAGTFYGLQTLRKAIRGGKGDDVLYPAATIGDAPRFAYRGGELDCARHFFPVDSVKTFIDMLAMHNINKFHWHLTDDQGWRIEIKSRPRLTEVGSQRSQTVLKETMFTDSLKYDGIPHGGYYTQEQVRDVVDYAAKRHIAVIPEIDLPGHMIAALASYPELGCTGGPYEVWQKWGGSEDILCAGNDSVYAFLNDVLDEVVELFPSEYVHIGGDEAPTVVWEKCPKCQAKIKELGFKDDKNNSAEHKLQAYMMEYAAKRLADHGRRVIGWDEIIGMGADRSMISMSWRGPHGGYDGARLGYDVIKASNHHLYFDYQFAKGDSIGAPYDRKIPFELTYSFEPIPEDYTPEEAAHVLGVQGNVWTEYLDNFHDVQYMSLPRMAALSDIQWSAAPKNYDGFIVRLKALLPLYEAEGYNYRPLD